MFKNIVKELSIVSPQIFYLNSLHKFLTSVLVKMPWIGYLLFFLLVESCRASACTGHKKGLIPPNTCHGETIKYDESFLVDVGSEITISKCICRVTSRRLKSPQFDLAQKYCLLRGGNSERTCKENQPEATLVKDVGLQLKFEIIHRNDKHFLCVEVDDDYLGGEIDEDSLALDCQQSSSGSSVRKSSSPSENQNTSHRKGSSSSSSGVQSENRSSDRNTALNTSMYRPDRLKVDESSDGMSGGAVAGIVIGGIAICALIVGLSIFLLIRYRRSGSLWPKPTNIAYGTSEMDVRIVSGSKMRGDEPSANYYSSYLVPPPNLKNGKTTLKKEKERPPVAPPRPNVTTQINKKKQSYSDACAGVDNENYVEPISPNKSEVSPHDKLRPEYSNNKMCTDNDYLTPINSDVTTSNEYVEPALIENASKITESSQEVTHTNSAFIESESIYETIA